MSQLIGGSAPLQCPVDMSFWQQLVTRQCDWKNFPARLDLYAVLRFFLGCSAALWGSWLEKVGPRLVSFVATLCWCGGPGAGERGNLFFISCGYCGWAPV